MATVLVTMVPMMEEVHERTSKDEEVRKYPQEVCSVFRKQKECGDSEETNQYPSAAAVLPLDCMGLLDVVHC